MATISWELLLLFGASCFGDLFDFSSLFGFGRNKQQHIIFHMCYSGITGSLLRMFGRQRVLMFFFFELRKTLEMVNHVDRFDPVNLLFYPELTEPARRPATGRVAL